MKMIRMVSIFLARIFISFVFLAAALDKIFNWQETERNLLTMLCDWQTYAGYLHSIQECMAAFVPWSSVLLVIGVIFELLGSLMLIFGFREKWGALLLIIFLIPVTLVFHPFWFMEGMNRELQAAMFFKNLAILGGLILISIYGAKTKEDSAGF